MEKTTSADGTTIAYDRYGEGPPVIVIAGAFSERTHQVVTTFADLLSPSFTVYAYDRRGRGDSGDTAPYTVQREVEDLAAVVEQAGGSASVYGLGSGGSLALEAAAAGVAITKLVVQEPPYVAAGDEPRVPATFAGDLAGLVDADRRGDAVALFMTQQLGIPAEAIADMRHSLTWPALEGLAHTLVYDATITGDGTIPVERAGAVRAETTVIAGANSPEWMRNSARALADAVPGARYRPLAGMDHFSMDPTLVAPALLEYFA
ncbi:alpha/beta fold hydrolase [Actinophytocola sediminis]